MIDRVKRGTYALQLNESTDVSGLAQLIVFVRYIADGKLEEELLMCVALFGTCTGEDILVVRNGFFDGSPEEQEPGACRSDDVIIPLTVPNPRLHESAKNLVENQFNFKKLVLVLMLCSFKIY